MHIVDVLAWLHGNVSRDKHMMDEPRVCASIELGVFALCRWATTSYPQPILLTVLSVNFLSVTADVRLMITADEHCL